MTNNECSICFESFSDEQKINFSSCQHWVCYVCAVPLFHSREDKKKEKCRCPLCRRETIIVLNKYIGYEGDEDDDLPDPIDNRND